MTPYEIWTGKHPRLSFLKVWECDAYVKRLMSDKLTPKSDKIFFVDYPRETKGYYFYNKAVSHPEILISECEPFFPQET
jgi:hypothetical protein